MVYNVQEYQLNSLHKNEYFIHTSTCLNKILPSRDQKQVHQQGNPFFLNYPYSSHMPVLPKPDQNKNPCHTIKSPPPVVLKRVIATNV